MQANRLIFSMAVSMVFAACCLAEEPQWSSTQQDVLNALSTGPINIHNDFESWEDGYHPDWTFWNVGSEATRDRETHMGLVRDFLAGGAVVRSFALTPVDVIIHGETALVRYTADEVITNSDGSERTVSFSAVSFMVFENDQWLIRASNLVFPPAQH